MHARAGMTLEYLGEDWFHACRVAVVEAEKQGMQAWLYDENGWPSGFADGKVNGMGEQYQQKYLRCEESDAPKITDHTIANIDCNGKNLHFYYDVNPFYVDVLNKKVIANVGGFAIDE